MASSALKLRLLKLRLQQYIFLAPILFFCMAVGLEHGLDHLFFGDDCRVSCEKLAWTDPAKDGPAAIKEVTARFIVEIADLALAISGAATLAWCSYLTVQAWPDVDKCSKAWLAGSAIVAVALTALIFHLLNPLKDSLPFAMTAHAAKITERPMIDFWRIEFSILVFIVLAAALASGLIVARRSDLAETRNKELGSLTTLLFLTATMIVLFMLRVGGTMLCVASLLPRADAGEAALARQLAIAMSVNYGIFFALLLACLHLPSVWAVTNKVYADQLGSEQTSAKKHYADLGAILSPVLAGIPLTKLLDAVFS
jgi:hypothetical protein